MTSGHNASTALKYFFTLCDSPRWWRFIIQGGVDGYSRAIMFLGLSDNNRAETILQHVTDGVLFYKSAMSIMFAGTAAGELLSALCHL